MTYYKYYHYDPSLVAACIFTIVFGALTIWHIGLLTKYKTWYSCPVIIAGIFEASGYIARAVSHSEAPNLSLTPYVIQTLLLLVAPPLLAATIYMTLGRIILCVDAESYSLIRPTRLTTVFVASDVVCFLIQLAGAGLMSSSHKSSSETGSDIVLVGLWVQIIIFTFFVVIAAMVHRRLHYRPTTKFREHSLPWKKSIIVLYATSGLILARNIVRVAEFIEGFEGYIIKHEVILYLFDAVPISTAILALNIWHPLDFFNAISRDGNRLQDLTVENGSV